MSSRHILYATQNTSGLSYKYNFQVFVLSLTCRDIIISIYKINKQKRTNDYLKRDLDLYLTDLFWEWFQTWHRDDQSHTGWNIQTQVFYNNTFIDKFLAETLLTLRFFLWSGINTDSEH